MPETNPMQKLFEFQNKIKALKKDSENPFYQSSYFDINTLIATIKPVLNELGLIVVQPLTSVGTLNPNGVVESRVALKTILIDSESGEQLLCATTPLPSVPDPQKMGSVITYFRRYALQSMLFLEAEDDDGNAGAGKAVAPATEKESATGCCEKCGATMKMSKQGKPYCSALCWK